MTRMPSLGHYPFPDDCPDCDGKQPCEKHEHLAEPDGDSGHKGEPNAD
jgi:hypothetical protein